MPRWRLPSRFLIATVVYSTRMMRRPPSAVRTPVSIGRFDFDQVRARCEGFAQASAPEVVRLDGAAEMALRFWRGLDLAIAGFDIKRVGF